MLFPNIEKVAFLITDGKSNTGPIASSDYRRMKTEYEAQNIELFVIGIGKVDESKLNLLVENPLTHVILIKNFDDLNDVLGIRRLDKASSKKKGDADKEEDKQFEFLDRDGIGGLFDGTKD